MNSVSLALAGGGTVGSGVLTLLHRRRELFDAMGVRVDLRPVLVRDASRARAHEHPSARFSSDAGVLDGADVLVEVMGGVDAALALVLPFLEAGKPVVTANKALLAERWEVLKPFAARGLLHYEAAVMAGTPVVGVLATTLRASAVVELHAVLSGTCNYILSRMEDGASYAAALAEAQARGFAEDPPTLDVGGFDAAHKLAVLARLVADPDFAFSAVEVRGIEGIPEGEVLGALGAGRRVKLVASLVPDGVRWRAVVRPVVLDAGHALAALPASRNGLVFDADGCGPVLVSGGGAGGLVTASAVVGDLLAVVEGRAGHRPIAARVAPPVGLEVADLEEVCW